MGIVVTFAVVGTGGYFLMSRQMERNQIADYAVQHQSDAGELEDIGRERSDSADRLRELNEVLLLAARRPGAGEPLLIDRRNIIRASATSQRLVGTRVSDSQIDAALRSGKSYAGREVGKQGRTTNFEFVAPVDLPTGRFAYQVSYDDHFVSANLSAVRRTLGLIALLALFVGSAVFYLAGGRGMLRGHRARARRP
jgi:hypothetical protein